jgi:hypothetical protein
MECTAAVSNASEIELDTVSSLRTDMSFYNDGLGR